MNEIKYPYKCLNHFFGYCAENKQGEAFMGTGNEIKFLMVNRDICKEDWQKCKSFVTNTEANPFHPELVKAAKEK